MTTNYSELEDDIGEYLNPTRLINKILNTLNKEFYANEPDKYNSLMTNLYRGATNKNLNNLDILYHWLECSNFKEPKALAYLAKFETMHNLLEVECPSETKCKIMELWIATRLPFQIPQIFKIFAANIDSKKLDDLHQLQLVIFILRPNKQCLKTSDIRINMHCILRNLDFSKLPDVEVVKLMTLYPYLDKSIMTKIEWLYPNVNLESRIAMAQTLDLVENPDYWIQNLPTQPPYVINDKIVLPEM